MARVFACASADTPLFFHAAEVAEITALRLCRDILHTPRHAAAAAITALLLSRCAAARRGARSAQPLSALRYCRCCWRYAADDTDGALSRHMRYVDARYTLFIF